MIIREKPSSTATALRTSPVPQVPPGRDRAVRAAAFAAAVAVVCAVAVFGAAGPGAVRAGAAITRAHARTGTAAAAAAASRDRSGLPWASGAYLPNGTPAAARAFGNWRRRPLDIVEVWLSQFGGESALEELLDGSASGASASTSERPRLESEPIDNPFPPGYGEDLLDDQ